MNWQFTKDDPEHYMANPRETRNSPGRVTRGVVTSLFRLASMRRHGDELQSRSEKVSTPR